MYLRSVNWFGDSITEGAGYDGVLAPNSKGPGSTVSPPLELQSELRKLGNSYACVQNFGYSGDTTQMGYERWSDVSPSEASIICYGYNDANGYSGIKLDIDDSEQYLRSFISREVARTKIVVVLLQQDLRDPEHHGNFERYRGMQRRVAQEMETPTFEMQAIINVEDRWCDGVHLTNAAYVALGRGLATPLLALRRGA